MHFIVAGRICIRGRFIALQRKTPLYAFTFLDDSNREEMLESVWVSSQLPQIYYLKVIRWFRFFENDLNISDKNSYIFQWTRKTPIRSNYFVDASLTIPNLEVDLLEKGKVLLDKNDYLKTWFLKTSPFYFFTTVGIFS